jgi:hypothetical protein
MYGTVSVAPRPIKVEEEPKFSVDEKDVFADESGDYFGSDVVGPPSPRRRSNMESAEMAVEEVAQEEPEFEPAAAASSVAEASAPRTKRRSNIKTVAELAAARAAALPPLPPAPQASPIAFTQEDERRLQFWRNATRNVPEWLDSSAFDDANLIRTRDLMKQRGYFARAQTTVPTELRRMIKSKIDGIENLPKLKFLEEKKRRAGL